MSILGISYPFRKGSFSFPERASDDEVIADNIRRILQTPKGSRVMRPEIGCDAWSIVFDSVGPVMNARLEVDVRRSIPVGEPRVRVLGVTATTRETSGGDTGTVVEVEYEVNSDVRKTATSFSTGRSG